MKQIPLIESLRAIAAISVCLFHFVCTTIGLFSNQKLLSIFSVGQYGVHIFFVISGFIIPYSMFHNNYKITSFFRFVAKRFIRLEPPYLVSIALILSIIFLKHHFHFGVDEIDKLSANRVLLHFGYLINFFPNYHWLNNVFWTLAIEFQFYIFIAFTFMLFIQKKIVYRIIGYLVCFLIAILPIPHLSNHFPVYAPLFLMGISVFLYKSSVIHKTEFWLVFGCCVVYNLFYADYMFATVGGLTALGILFFPNIKIPVFHNLGKISYSLYLIHPVIGAAVINILSRHVETPFQKTGIVCLGFIITIISSYSMYFIVEKPSKKLSSNIKL